jgi:hypothetical protein
MRNIDNLIQNVYDETGVMGEIQITFDPVEGEWHCRIVEDRMVWLDDAGERYLFTRDFDLATAMQRLDQLCARQPAASIL